MDESDAQDRAGEGTADREAATAVTPVGHADASSPPVFDRGGELEQWARSRAGTFTIAGERQQKVSDHDAHGMDCQQCGMHLDHPAEYHPYLFCELYHLGHHDPSDYLKRSLGHSALLLLPRWAGTNVADHFAIVERSSV